MFWGEESLELNLYQGASTPLTKWIAIIIFMNCIAVVEEDYPSMRFFLLGQGWLVSFIAS